MVARYEGDIVVKFLPDGRNLELVSDVVFHDPDDTRWAVPKGAIVDGASIPRPLWTIVGSPLTGRYRDASVVHDWFCDRRTRTWQETHRVFYDAMIVSGVSEAMAKLLYLGVRWAGPRWEERVTHNAVLTGGGGDYRSLADILKSIQAGEPLPSGTRRVSSPADAIDEQTQEQVLQGLVDRVRGFDLDEIDRRADRERPDDADA